MAEEKCKKCGGYGNYADHDFSDTRPEHFNDGDCQSCPIQVKCEDCGGTGVITINKTL